MALRGGAKRGVEGDAGREAKRGRWNDERPRRPPPTLQIPEAMPGTHSELPLMGRDCLHEMKKLMPPPYRFGAGFGDDGPEADDAADSGGAEGFAYGDERDGEGDMLPGGEAGSPDDQGDDSDSLPDLPYLDECEPIPKARGRGADAVRAEVAKREGAKGTGQAKGSGFRPIGAVPATQPRNAGGRGYAQYEDEMVVVDQAGVPGQPGQAIWACIGRDARVLVFGDTNMSLSHSIASLVGSAWAITATTPQLEDTQAAYDNLRDLLKAGATVCTTLELEDFETEKMCFQRNSFDFVAWAFPRSPKQARTTPSEMVSILQTFLQHAGNMICSSGHVVVAVGKERPYPDEGVYMQLAAAAGLELIAQEPFPPPNFRAYSPRLPPGSHQSMLATAQAYIYQKG